jgi:hypothetical protein
MASHGRVLSCPPESSHSTEDRLAATDALDDVGSYAEAFQDSGSEGVDDDVGFGNKLEDGCVAKLSLGAEIHGAFPSVGTVDVSGTVLESTASNVVESDRLVMSLSSFVPGRSMRITSAPKSAKTTVGNS